MVCPGPGIGVLGVLQQTRCRVVHAGNDRNLRTVRDKPKLLGVRGAAHYCAGAVCDHSGAAHAQCVLYFLSAASGGVVGAANLFGVALVTPKEQDTIQPDLALARPGVLSYVWNLGYGDILIEVFDDGRVRVNQQEVELTGKEGER